MNFSRKNVMTLVGALVLAGVLVVGGVYGPTAWKVFTGQDQSSNAEQVIVQTPPVDQVAGGAEGEGTTPDPNAGTTPEGDNVPSGQVPENVLSTMDEQGDTTTNPDAQTTTPGQPPNPPAGSTTEPKKYQEPDVSRINLAPAMEGYFGEQALSDASCTLIFGAAWNIHQYVDGYLFGVTAGPQMNEEDIRKYIVFHKALWEKQMESEANAINATTLSTYLTNLLNRGVDAFDSKDPIRIDQFHQEIHDLDTHLMRDDMSSNIFGATPFSTKRSE